MQSLKKAWDWLWNDGAGAFVLFLLILLTGGAMLFGVLKFGSIENNALHKTLYEVSKILITTISVQPLFRLLVWRRAADSFLAKLQTKEAVTRSGMVNFFMFSKVPWEDLFADVKTVTAVAISARLFTESSIYGLVRKFLSKTGTTLTIVLLNPESEKAAALDAQFGEDTGKRKAKTLEVVQELRALTHGQGIQGKVTIRFTEILPRYTCYVFDEQFIFSTYRMKPGRAPHGVPTFSFEGGQFISEYLRDDIEYITNAGSKEFWSNKPTSEKQNAT